MPVLPQEVFQCATVGFDSPQEPAGKARIRERHLNGLLKPHAARQDVVNDAKRRLQCVVVRQDGETQVMPCAGDSLRGFQFFLPAEQRDVSHLHQVGTDRPRFVFLHVCLLNALTILRRQPLFLFVSNNIIRLGYVKGHTAG